MHTQIIEQNGVKIALVTSTELILKDVNSALDLMATIRYESDCDRIALNKEAVSEDFFCLSTGLAGDILQKFVNYQLKFAVYGDFSQYTSKPLQDFIYESNNGTHVFFAADQDDAISKLANAK